MTTYILEHGLYVMLRSSQIDLGCCWHYSEHLPYHKLPSNSRLVCALKRTQGNTGEGYPFHLHMCLNVVPMWDTSGVFRVCEHDTWQNLRTRVKFSVGIEHLLQYCCHNKCYNEQTSPDVGIPQHRNLITLLDYTILSKKCGHHLELHVAIKF